MPAEQLATTLADYQPRLEDDLVVEKDENIDLFLGDDVTGLYGDGVKKIGGQEARLYASIEIGNPETDRRGRMVGIFGVNKGFDKKSFYAVEGDAKNEARKVIELKPNKYVKGKGYALLLGKFADELVLGNRQRRKPMKVTAHVIPNPDELSS